MSAQRLEQKGRCSGWPGLPQIGHLAAMRTARSGGAALSVISLLQRLELGSQSCATPRARQLEVAEPREAVELGGHRILGKGLGQRRLHLVAIVGAAHGDEINDDSARNVA